MLFGCHPDRSGGICSEDSYPSVGVRVPHSSRGFIAARVGYHDTPSSCFSGVIPTGVEGSAVAFRPAPPSKSRCHPERGVFSGVKACPERSRMGIYFSRRQFSRFPSLRRPIRLDSKVEDAALPVANKTLCHCRRSPNRRLRSSLQIRARVSRASRDSSTPTLESKSDSRTGTRLMRSLVFRPV
jgi:hypothetical protein